MKIVHPTRALLALTVAIVSTACHKPNPVDEMEKAAVAISKMEKTAVTPGSEPDPAGTAPPPAQQLQQAIVDYKAGKMEDAVTRLQLLRAMPAMSPEQRMAVQDSVAALMTEIYSLAEKGDPRAIAAVAQYERMQSGRR